MERALAALRSAGLLVSVEGPSGGSTGFTAVCADSRLAAPGCVFVAVRGHKTDGMAFAVEAVRRGAVAVVSDRPIRIGKNGIASRIARIRVRDSAKALGVLSALADGYPSSRLSVYGVTGTNGKTTTTYLIRHMLNGLKHRTALLGTVSEEVPGRRPVSSALTTPDVLKLNRFFRHALDAECDAAVFEVSSHSLDQRRGWGIQFDTVVFTNLTQDHLDYHKTMGEYFEAKKRLFTEYEYRKAVVNVDDPYGRRLAGELLKRGRRVVTFGRRAGADVRILAATSDLRGIRARLQVFGKNVSARVGLIGDYNLSNAAAAIASCADPSNITHILRLLASPTPPPGRMERVESGQAFVVLVDYAHTPDALEKLLMACRRINPRRLICVFGCGGDRDRGKRPKMGAVATRLADMTIVTSDNPRTENPMKILEDIRPGLRGREGRNFMIEPDRRRAIGIACRLARRGEMLVIAGKGHETYQIIGTVKYPFDDRKIAHSALREKSREMEC